MTNVKVSKLLSGLSFRRLKRSFFRLVLVHKRRARRCNIMRGKHASILKNARDTRGWQKNEGS